MIAIAYSGVTGDMMLIKIADRLSNRNRVLFQTGNGEIVCF